MGSASDASQIPEQQVRRGEEESEGVDIAQASVTYAEEGKSEVFISFGERPGEDPSLNRINGAMMGSSPGSFEPRLDLVENSVQYDAEPITSNKFQLQENVPNMLNYIQNNPNFTKKEHPIQEIKFLKDPNKFQASYNESREGG
jgi:hypothetical protein